MDPISAAAAAAATLQDLATSVPPGGTRRYWNWQQRQDAYLRFQRAAHDAESWAGHLRLLQEVNETLRPAAVVSTSGGKLADFLAALDALRLLGNPGPRAVGEEIASLLGALFDTVGTGRPISRHRKALSLLESHPAGGARRMPWLAKAMEQVRDGEAAWLTVSDRFTKVQQALGHAHRAFTLAARDDLGRGRRWWHMGRALRSHWWQWWRTPEAWPGGFPPPCADELITRYRAE